MMNEPEKIAWDAEVEPPATIAVIGAGPLGIETSIYARFLGYDVMLYDIGRPARYVKRWHERLLPACVQDLTTPLGWAALASQRGEDLQPPADTRWTGKQWEEEYLTPLAKTDLIYESVFFNTRVAEVGRLSFRTDECDDFQSRCNDEFFLTLQSQLRGEYNTRADIVIDCRSARQTIAGLGVGGMKAIGQTALDGDLLTDWPLDFIFDDQTRRDALIDKKIFLVGDGGQSQRFALEFVSAKWLSETAKLYWLVRPSKSGETQTWIEDNLRTNSTAASVQVINGWGLTKLRRSESSWLLEFLSGDESLVEMIVDHVVGLASERYDGSITKSLHLNRDGDQYDSPRSTKTWPESSVASNADNQFDLGNTCRSTTDEPHYFCLPSSAKNFGPEGMQYAYSAITDLFALLGGRSNLDLYKITAAARQ